MSYILEALKRAERERRHGQAPTALDDVVNTPAAETAGSPLRSRLLLALLLVAAVAAGAGAVLLLQRPAPTPAAAPQAAVTPPPPAQAAAETPAAAPTEADAKIADGDHIASLDDLTGDDTSPAADATSESAPPAPAEAAPSRKTGSAAKPRTRSVAPPAVTAAPAAVSAARPESAAAPVLAAAATASPAEAQPAAPGASADPAAGATPAPASTSPAAATPHGGTARPTTPGIDAIKTLKDMPPAYRAGFPAISIDVLAYTDDPARSFVILGGKRYKAGDNIAEGPHIADIVPEGILFDWHGERVLVSPSR